MTKEQAIKTGTRILNKYGISTEDLHKIWNFHNDYLGEEYPEVLNQMTHREDQSIFSAAVALGVIRGLDYETYQANSREAHRPKRGRPPTVTNKQSTTKLGTLLRKHRSRTGAPLRHIASNAGISIAFLSNVEMGKATLPWNTIKKVATSLGIPLKKLAKANLEGTRMFQEYTEVLKAA